MSMPPDPVTGFCILPRLATIVEDLSRAPTATPVARVLLGELPKGRGVEVEGLDVDADLVGPHLPAGVQVGGPPAAT
jgi:hypothetical protein